MNKQGGGQISGNYGCGTEKRRVLKTKDKTCTGQSGGQSRYIKLTSKEVGSWLVGWGEGADHGYAYKLSHVVWTGFQT